MKKLFSLLVFTVFLLLSQTSSATHMMGGEITYKSLSPKKYEVTLRWFRDCRGISLNGGGTINIRCTNGGTRTVSLGLVSIRSVTSTGCTPTNTIGSGQGIEEHIYRGVVDFNILPLSTLGSCSGDIIFSASINARNGAITTGPSGTLYVQTLLDMANAPSNSSPTFDFDPIAFMCCDQPSKVSWSGTDVDGDSLSYEWTQPLRGYAQTTPYSGGFSYDNPISTFYPGSLTHPYNNPNATPPIGLFLNNKSGEVIFTPTNCNQVTVMTIKISEWARNGLGVMVKHGEVTRDGQVSISTCAGNKVPEVTSSLDPTLNFNSCLNNLEVIVSTADFPFVPPPPGITPAPDSVAIIVKGSSIPGVITEILDVDSLNPKLKVSITDDYLLSKNYENHVLYIPFELRDNQPFPEGISQNVLKIKLVNTSGPKAKLTGVVLSDANTNCSADAGEDSLRYKREIAIQDSSTTYYIDSDNIGAFNNCILVDSLDIRLVESPWFDNDCGDTVFLAEKDSSYDVTLYSKMKSGLGGVVLDNRNKACSVSSTAVPRVGQLLKLLPSNQIVSTDKDGFYLFEISSSGSYSIVLLEDSSTYYANNCVDTLTVSYGGSGIQFVDTLLTHKIYPVNPQVFLTASRGTQITRGGTSVLRAHVLGAESLSSIILNVKVATDALVSPSSTLASAGWVSMGGNIFSTTITNPGASEIRSLPVYAPPSKYLVNDLIVTEAWIDTVAVDSDSSDNRRIHTLRVRGPYDPNIKVTAQDSLFTTDSRWLDYTISFQNTGNAPAVKVVVKDTLPVEVSLEDIEFISASHEYYPVLNNRELRFVFENINLADSSSDSEGSIGSVTFRIPIDRTIFRDTLISNRASIYFDFEEPVLTPTQTNHFKTPIDMRADKSVYCPSDSLKVDFNTIFTPSAGNRFYLQLTDQSGDLATFRNIDSVISMDTFGQFSVSLDTGNFPAGTYTYRVASSNFKTVAFEQYYGSITVLPHQEIKLNADTDTVCFGEQINVSSSWNGVSNKWFINGDSFTNTSTIVSDTFKNGDEFYLESISAEGCTFLSDSVRIIVRNAISVSFVGDTFTCAPENSIELKGRIAMEGNGPGVLGQLNYDFGDGVTAQETDTIDILHTFLPQSTSLVQIAARTNEGCTDTVIQQVMVGVAPSSSFEIVEDSLCTGDQLVAIGTSNTIFGFKDEQSFFLDGNLLASTGDTLRNTINSQGNYSLKLRVTDNFGCQDSSELLVVVAEAPVASFILSDSSICVNLLPINVSSTSSNVGSFDWFFDGVSYTQSTLELNPGVGEETLLLRTQNGKCFDTASVSISVFDTTQAKFNLPAEICQNQTLNLIAENIRTTTDYTWGINGAVKTGTSTDSVVQEPGVLQIDLWTSSTDGGCRDSVSKNITVVQTGDTGMFAEDVCEGEIVKIVNTSETQDAIFTYLFGDGNEQTGATYTDDIEHQYGAVGEYQITQISTLGRCADSLVYSVEVLPTPVASFTVQNVSGQARTVSIGNISTDANTFEWQFGDGNSSNSSDLSFNHQYSTQGDFTIQLVAISDGGCRDTFSQTQSVFSVIKFMVPNAFSPDGNGLNDTYNVEPRGLIESLDMEIYNRWGQLVAKSSKTQDILEPLPQGVYVYKLDIRDVVGEKHTFRGTFTVLVK